MANKRHATLADYMVIAISPALLIGLIASLVFFLLEVVYEGDFTSRLRWILFFYVFGAVLVARLSMETAIADRAAAYGLILAAAAWVGLNLFVEYPTDTPLKAVNWLINLGLVGLVWWCAYKLTWDCTYIDDNEEASGRGLLYAVGMEPSEGEAETADGQEDDSKSWWEQFQAYRRSRKKKHTPGTWVVYFSLAALPLFGLGQSLIPVEDGDRRFRAFVLLGIYTACGLGLLLTTCFLGLRRYLRQKKIQMPIAMAGTWLGSGLGLIVLLLVVGAFLPRPVSETPLVSLDSRAGGERQASDYASKGDSPAKGEGNAASESGEKNQDAKPGSQGQIDNKNGGQSAKTDKSGNSSEGGKGNSSQSGQKGDSSSKSQQSSSSSGSNNNQSSNQKDKKQSERSSGGGKGGQASSSQNRSSNSRKATSSASSWTNKLPQSIQGAAKVLQWIVVGVIAVGLIGLVLWRGLSFLAAFTAWAKALLDFLRNFWARLFGAREEPVREREESPVERQFTKPGPFSAFSNPFSDGRAEVRSPQELVRYSFAALQAWAFEREQGRSADQTPLEFVEQLSQEWPGLEGPARRLMVLLVRVEYAGGGLPASAIVQLKEFWARLEAMEEHPAGV